MIPRPPTGVSREPRRLALTALSLGLAAGACSFDGSGPAAQGGGSQADGSPDGPGQPDAMPVTCAEPLQGQLLVGGLEAPGPGGPLATVLLGDTVALAATGWCSERGPVSYDWDVEDDLLAATGSPGLDAESLTVYPKHPGDYQVTLTVRDGVETSSPITVPIAIHAIGWQRVDQTLDVRDLAIGAGRVWIASTAGPRFMDLADLAAGPQDVNAIAAGVDVPSEPLSAVHFADGLVWFGRQASDSAIWRLDLSAMEIQRIDFPITIDQAVVRDVSSQDGGISVATAEGVTLAPDNRTLSEPLLMGTDVAALAENDAGGWAGAADLIRLSDEMHFTPFGSGDNKIVSLAGDDDLVWVAGDDKGVARFSSATLLADVFTGGDGLPSNKVRALAVDRQHDVWLATQNGAGRYKRDRGAWLGMAANDGLAGITDLSAVAVQMEGTSPVIAVGGTGGGNAGIALLRLP